jgi:hypothetical protein
MHVVFVVHVLGGSNFCAALATRDLQVGNGIKFTDLSAEDREKLERFLTQT